MNPYMLTVRYRDVLGRFQTQSVIVRAGTHVEINGWHYRCGTASVVVSLDENGAQPMVAVFPGRVRLYDTEITFEPVH